MSAKHTPGRWQQGPRGTQVYGPDNHLVANCGAGTGRLHSEQVANAELIVRAVNVHEDLIEALKGFRWLGKIIYNIREDPKHFEQFFRSALEDAEAAIAKAEDTESQR